MPSWYPSPELPTSGIFVREQVDAITRTHRDVELHVLHVPMSGPEVTPRQPIASLPRAVRFARTAAWTSRRVRDNWMEHTFRRIQLSERLAWTLELRDCRRWLRARRAAGEPVHMLHAHVAAHGGMLAVRLGREFGVPVLLTEHMSPFPLPSLQTADGSPRPEVVEACRDAARVVAVSAALATDIRRLTGVEALVVPNGVDGAHFHPSDDRARAAGPVFVGAGFLVPQKGFDDLLRAFHVVAAAEPAACLRIVGDGPERGTLARLAAELGIADRVEWLGQLPRDEVARAFRAADVFVLSSRHESLGMVVIEALASGLPVVATDCGGPRDLVSADTGRLVPVGAPAALAAAMRSVAREMSAPHAPSRSRFEAHFSAERTADRVVRLYDEVLRDAEPGRRVRGGAR
ncbi:glycosyltransferase [Roseisolibacter sp. H3M3-2]|uniref:glycosyltransferase n=1 Tax=Roseisolibacter sp. H3M3-2 TaxID=3031323 RepID=UPI0023DB04C1|nr:glycosyltransferase [Roseisolibacter sp. H3M3-2]